MANLLRHHSLELLFATVMALFILILHFDGSFPTALNAAEKVTALMGSNSPHYPNETTSACNMCGVMLENIDYHRMTMESPFYGFRGLVLGHGTRAALRSCQRDLTNQRGCDTLRVKLQKEKHNYANYIIEKSTHSEEYSGFVSRHMNLLHAYVLRAEEEDETEEAVLGMDRSASAVCPDRPIFDVRLFSPISAPGGLPVQSPTWFLRVPLHDEHQRFCYPLCEGRLSVMDRLRLRFWRWYLAQNVDAYIHILATTQSHVLTCLFLIMILMGIVLASFSCAQPALILTPYQMVGPQGMQGLRAEGAGGAIGSGGDGRAVGDLPGWNVWDWAAFQLRGVKRLGDDLVGHGSQLDRHTLSMFNLNPTSRGAPLARSGGRQGRGGRKK